MFVAYNRFYPPDLAHHEERTASPDRSHNETYDALINTGVLGLAAYLALISGALETALRYLGLLGSPGTRRRFWLCLAAGLALGIAVPPLADGSWRFLGLGIPAGILAGLAAYLALGLMGRARTEAPPATPELPALLLAVGLLAAIIAHYVEIHLGIAIAATRLYFWLYLAILAQFARGELALSAPAEALPTALATEHRGGRRGAVRAATIQRHTNAGRGTTAPNALPYTWALALISGAVLATLAWDYVVNPLGDGNALRVLWRSLTTLSARTGTADLSLGVPALLFSVLCVSLLLTLAEVADSCGTAGWRLVPVLRAWAAGSLGTAAIYALIQAAALGPTGQVSRLIFAYLALLAAVGGALAYALMRAQVRRAAGGVGPLWPLYPLLLAAAGVLIWIQNVDMIRADIYYKQGQRIEQQGAWDQAIATYRQAVALQPQQDYYLLYLGRAQLERTKLEADAATREALFAQTEATLLQAQQLAPLNTDHLSNLARLYRTRAALSSDDTLRQSYIEQSSDYYRRALSLSPNSAALYNEWAAVYLDGGQYARAEELLAESLAIDSQFGQTYMVLGDSALVRLDYAAAITHYRQAVEIDRTLTAAWGRLAYAYYQTGNLPQAIEAGLALLEVAPEDFETLKNLAVIYREMGQADLAAQYAGRALAVAPDESSQVSLQQFIDELETTGE
jgi:tetratricopeptide (TPR) repeat protein